jgi:hypothetical protein
MARAPRAEIPKTSGQGISRLVYQKQYALGSKGKQRVKVASKAPSTGNTRSYGKEKGGDFNIAYAGMFDPQEELK